MDATEVRMLWVYASELWGSTFSVADDSRLRKVKEQVWLDTLADLDAELVRRAMVAMGTHFAPTPSELRDAALNLARSERGERPEPDHAEALEELHRLIARHGYMRPTEALEAAEAYHPALASAIRSLGWLEICQDENEAVFRGQFRQIYERARERLARGQQAPAPVLAAVRQVADQLGSGS